MLRLLEQTAEYGGLLEVHAENYDIIKRASELLAAAGNLAPLFHARAHSVLAEEEAVGRAAAMAEATGGRLYVVHLSSARGLERIRQARQRGAGMLAETCPQYLTLDEERYAEPDWAGAKYVMSPPLRTRADGDALWRALRDGEVQTVGTDHCSFNFKGHKDMAGRSDFRKIPNGAPGIETMLMLLHSEGVAKGRISLERMVDVLSASTARIFGLKDKGEIAPGKDADIVVFDPHRRFSISRERLHQNVDYTPWEGQEVAGMPSIVYSRGRRVAEWAGDRMRFVGRAGWGRFVKRAAYPARSFRL
jgi:dihydropyrimidinase